MAQLVGTLGAYSGVGVQSREDLIDFITNLSPQETPVLSMLERVAATGVEHEWLEDTFRAAITTGVPDGNEFAAQTQVVPARRKNYTHISQQFYAVSGSMQAADNVGGSWTGYNMRKALREIALDIEAQLITGVLNGPGTSAEGRRMAGISQWLRLISGGTIEVVLLASTPIDETRVGDLLQKIFNSGSGLANTIIASPSTKRAISGFTLAERAHHMGEGVSDPRTIIRNVQKYESDFGTCDVFVSRNCTVANEIFGYAINRQYFRTAWLRPPTQEMLPKTGDSSKIMVQAEVTLEVLSSKAGGKWATTTAGG